MRGLSALLDEALHLLDVFLLQVLEYLRVMAEVGIGVGVGTLKLLQSSNIPHRSWGRGGAR
jgi:hypothetical protein